MGVPSAVTSGVVVRVTFNDRKNAHCQQNLTPFRLRFLQFCRHAPAGGHCSFKAERSRLPRVRAARGTSGLWNTVERWSSDTLQWENRALDRSKISCKRLTSVGELDDPGTTTKFFFDELMEANLNMEKLAERNSSADATQPCPTQEEATSQWLDDADREKSRPETDLESGKSNLDFWQSFKNRQGKLPMESNGPPMVILQPYLVSDNSQEEVKEKEKLRPLPYTEPHKMRPPGLPRPSLRRRLGLADFRKSVPAGQVGEFSSKSTYED